MKKQFVYSVIALGAIPVVANADVVQKQTVTFDKAAWEAAGATVNDAGLIISSPEGSEIKYTIGILQKGKYVFAGKLKTKLYKVTVKIGGKTQEIEPDPDNDQNVDLEFELDKATNVELTLTSAGNGVTGSEFTLGSPVLNLKFDFADAKQTLTNALNALETTDMAAYPYNATADKAAMKPIKTKIDAIAESYEAYAAQELYDLANCPIQKDIDALKATIASKQNTQAFNDVSTLLNDIKGKFGVAKTNIETELTGAAAYLMTSATKDLNAINDAITNLIQANTTAKNAGKAVAEKAGIVSQIPSEDDINALVTKYTGETGLATQAKTNKDAYQALMDKVTTLQTNLDNVKYVDESLTEPFAKERAAAQKAITDIKTAVEGVYNKEAQLTKSIDGDVTTAQGKITTLAGKVTTANSEFTANANAVKDIATLQGKLDAAKTAVNAKVSADTKYKAQDFYAKYVEDVQKEIKKLSDDAKAAYKVNGTGTAGTYYSGLAAKITPIETEISDYQTNAIAAVNHYDALQDAMAAYQIKLNAARAIYSGKEYYAEEGANYNFKYSFDLLQKEINDIQTAIDAATAKKDGAAQVVGTAHWTKMNAIPTRALFTETFTSVADLDGKSFSIVNAADGKAFFGSTAQHLGYDIFGKSYLPTNTGYVFKLESTGTADQYLLQLYKPTGEKYNCWNMGGWLNTQAADKDCCFILGLSDKNGQDITNGAVWEVKFVADKGFTIKNIGTGKYLKDNGPAKYDDPTYFNFKAVDGNSIEAKIFALENRETNADNNWAADGLTGGGVKDLQDKIKAFKQKYTEETLGTEFGDDTHGYKKAEKDIEDQLKGIVTNIESTDKNDPKTATAITGYGNDVSNLAVLQANLEKAAEVIYAGVTGNKTLQTLLQGKVTTLDGKITAFKTAYGMNSPEDATILGNSFNDVKTVENAIKTELGEASTAINAIVPTNVAVEDKSSVVSIDNWKTGVQGGNFQKYGDGYYEKWNESNNVNGDILYQTVEVPNGVYTIELYAASDQSNKDEAMDVVYLYANDVKLWIPSKKDNNAKDVAYTLDNVVVNEGTLRFGLYKVKEGAKWHTLKLKSLTLHSTTANATALAAQKDALDGKGEVKGLIARQETLETQAVAIKDAVAAINTLSYDGLKNLEGVTDANGNYDNVAAKKSLTLGTGAEDWYIFKTGLKEGESFAERLKKVQDDEAAMKEAIKTTYNAGKGDFAGIWNKTAKSFGNYKVSDLQAAINLIKTDAGKELANWNAYNTTVNPYVGDVTTAINNALTADADKNGKVDLVEKAGAGALEYYQGVLGGYTTEKNTILTSMKNSLNERKAATAKGDDNSGYVSQLKALKTKANAVLAAAAANLAKYEDQKTGDFGYQKTQTLWNDVYTEIAGTDQTTKRQDWLDELDVIQLTLTAATNAVEENYKVGQSVAQAKDFAAIQTAINDVKTRQNASYSEFVTADNKAAHESFMGYEKDGKHVDGAIELATKAYQQAVEERAKYSSTNAKIKKAIDEAAATLDEALFNCPGEIATLTQQENEAYAGVVSPEVFNVSKFNADALTIEQTITNKLTDFRTAIATAMYGVWNPLATEYNTDVTTAETAIAAYSDDAKKDAFKDVKDAIADGNAAVTKDKNGIVIAVDIDKLEAAMNTLENIDDMLAADKDAAAVKDISAASTAANKAYNDTKTYIESKTIADDVDNVKATQLKNLKDAKDAADAILKTYPEAKWTFANHNNIKPALTNVVTKAAAAKKAVDDAITFDENNTKAYNEMVAAISPVEEKLTVAKGKVAAYKYALSFATIEQNLADIKSAVSKAKSDGKAKTYQTGTFNVTTVSTAIENKVESAFYAEKTGLSADITELKNQYNAYVAVYGVEAASAYKTAIDALEKSLTEIAIVDVDKPANGTIEYSDILAATDALIKLQNDIADKETELLAANASTANADVLADFTTQIGALETAASLEGKDAWVGEQIVNGKKISEAIAEIQAQIADVKAAIQGEANISFYKDRYQAKINAIKAVLDPVAEDIDDYQAQFTANADAFTTLSAAITTLQGKVDAAKAKVGAYEYNGVKYNHINLFEQYNDKEKLTGGLQKTINDADAALKTAKDNVSLTANSKLADFDLNVATAEETVQLYLDRSAYYEVWYQRAALSVDLTNAIDAKYKADKYSNALWKRLVTKKDAINGDINKLWYEAWNSYQVIKTTPTADYTDYTTDLDEQQNEIAKARTSDADYATHMQTVATIAQKIQDLSDAVDNLSLLGDANEDNTVNVLDYQKVLNMILDPTAQPAEESDLFQNVDINQNEVIEVGDLTSIVYYILNHDWNGYAAVNSSRGEKMEGESLTLTQGTNRIAVNLANVTDYTAFQMDLVLPEGMKLVGAQLSDRAGESHKLYSRAQLDGSIRMVASSVKGETFSGNEGAVLYLEVEGTGTPELLNILFSDVNAVTRSFAIGNDATGIDTASTFESLKQKVYDLGGRVKNGLKKGINIIRRADGTTGKVVK